MSIPSALVLFAVIWFLCLFIALPIRIQTQIESGKVVPGTPPSSPVDPKLGKKVKWVTVCAVAIWIAVAAIISSGWLSITMIDIFDRWGDGKYG